MKKRIVLAVLICFGIAGTASAGFMLSHDEKADIAVMYIIKKLDLDENQTGKLESIKDKLQKLCEEHKKEKAEKTQLLIEMIQSDQLDQAKIIELINAKMQKIEESAPGIIEMIADFHSTLSHEQKQIVIEKIQQHKHF
ncbi:MAG: hypothetical protein D6B28_10920 [Gammaproteobacteria bacterium]|nr:MAG: hypothetical protein D6B28_10920 [Gammaproteobacteria bacterium]